MHLPQHHHELDAGAARVRAEGSRGRPLDDAIVVGPGDVFQRLFARHVREGVEAHAELVAESGPGPALIGAGAVGIGFVHQGRAVDKGGFFDFAERRPRAAVLALDLIQAGAGDRLPGQPQALGGAAAGLQGRRRGAAAHLPVELAAVTGQGALAPAGGPRHVDGRRLDACEGVAGKGRGVAQEEDLLQGGAAGKGAGPDGGQALRKGDGRQLRAAFKGVGADLLDRVRQNKAAGVLPAGAGMDAGAVFGAEDAVDAREDGVAAFHLNGFEETVAEKGAEADACHVLRNGESVQRAVAEGIFPDALQTLGQRDLGQVDAVAKGVAADARHTVFDDQLRNALMQPGPVGLLLGEVPHLPAAGDGKGVHDGVSDHHFGQVVAQLPGQVIAALAADVADGHRKARLILLVVEGNADVRLLREREMNADRVTAAGLGKVIFARNRRIPVIGPDVLIPAADREFELILAGRDLGIELQPAVGFDLGHLVLVRARIPGHAAEPAAARLAVAGDVNGAVLAGAVPVRLVDDRDFPDFAGVHRRLVDQRDLARLLGQRRGRKQTQQQHGAQRQTQPFFQHMSPLLR